MPNQSIREFDFLIEIKICKVSLTASRDFDRMVHSKAPTAMRSFRPAGGMVQFIEIFCLCTIERHI